MNNENTYSFKATVSAVRGPTGKTPRQSSTPTPPPHPTPPRGILSAVTVNRRTGGIDSGEAKHSQDGRQPQRRT